jgi:hypothetical protein
LPFISKTRRCANCGDKEIHSSNNITPLRPEYSELIFTKPFYKKPTIWIITFVIVLVLLLIWLLWPKTIYGIVVGSEWKSIVKVERYQSVREDGWTVPTDATLVTNEGLRIHHYDKIQIGTKKVPYSESYKCGETCRTTARRCKNNHNGTASCSGGNRVCSAKYCTRTAYRTENVYKNQPRYRDWYSWNVWRWRFNRNVMCSGLDFKPKLPENINLNQNLHDQEQERMFVDWAYTIIFKDKHSEDKYKYYPTSESAFLSFHIGDSHTLKVSGIGVSIEK